MFYNYSFWGMDPLWWSAWFIMLVWIFILPYNIPGQRNKKDSPLDVLLKRYAAGEIGKEEYHERKRSLR
ncbi:SHOCT domain-containing protein [Mucilaginibacter sp. ZB1P21]|uniref:SHOCT domain-containing protein n=2 Tax=Mucilaginibacter glaciei TaxID=2772109 RepID=A0A926S2A9_9SPHI|nr:SHOCT domain-containing protein [Mucilaginibacter glaciei]